MFSNLLKPENIILDLESDEKDVLFAEMAESVVRSGVCVNRTELLDALNEREEKQNTCIMPGVAVPHASCANVKEPVVVIGVSKKGIDYEVEFSDDEDSLVHLVIMIVFEKGNTERHLHIMSECAELLQIKDFYKSILSAKSPKELIENIKKIEESL